jgi:ThiF family
LTSSFLAEARADYVRQLEALGFDKKEPDLLEGRPLEYPGTTKRPTIQIELTPGFPFERPKVYVLEPEYTAESWHLNASDDGRGYLCLFGHDGRNSDYPWSDPLLLVDRIREWFENDAVGWTEDPPVLEVHAYMPLAEDQLIVNPEHLDPQSELPLVIQRRPGYQTIWETARAAEISVSSDSVDALFSDPINTCVVDVGQIDRPPRTVEDFLGAASDRDQRRVDALLAAQGVAAVIVRYARGPNQGLQAVHASSVRGHKTGAAFFRTHLLSPEVLGLRAGPLARKLESTSIALVGVGAVGSFLADALVRCGARNLDLYDSDLLAPGNCVRHLCGRRYVGLWKSQAVRAHLLAQHELETYEIRAFTSVRKPEDVEQVLAGHWLTIDATADETASGLLINAAGNRNLISVCVLGDGQFVRADRWPTREPHLEAPSLRPPRGDLLYEAGCGDPVSPTPPYVPQAAASLANRMVLDLLEADGPKLPPTLMQETS